MLRQSCTGSQLFLFRLGQVGLKTPVNLIAATARIADMRLKNDSVSFEDIIKYFENEKNHLVYFSIETESKGKEERRG